MEMLPHSGSICPVVYASFIPPNGIEDRTHGLGHAKSLMSLSYTPHADVTSYIKYLTYSPPTKLGGGGALLKAVSPSITHVL